MQATFRSAQAGHAQIPAASQHRQLLSSTELHEAGVRPRSACSVSARATVCCAQAAELASAHHTAPEQLEPVDSDVHVSCVTVGSWDVDDIFSMCGEGGDVPDLSLIHI